MKLEGGEVVTAELYGGQHVVEFNPRAHRYKVIGKDALPDGVTTICNAVVPKFLDDWAGRVCVDHVRQGYLSHLSEHGLPPDRVMFEDLCDAGTKAHQTIRNSAGDRGSAAHDYIERVLTNQIILPPDDPVVMASLNAFSKWQDSGMCSNVIAAERIIYSKELFYCGKCDVFGTVDDRPAVIDFKTGSGFYDDHPYQLTGYAYALSEELEIDIEDGYIVHLDKRDGNFYIYHVKINDGLRDAWRLAVLHYKELKKIRQMVKELKYGVAKSKGTNGRQAEAR